MAATAFAVQAQQVKVEDQAKYRRGAYMLLAFNFGSLGAVAQDKNPFNNPLAA